MIFEINPLYAELNPTCQLLALLRAHHILRVSRIRIKGFEHTKRVLIFCTNFSRNIFILRIDERDMIKNVYWSSCEVRLFLLVFNRT